MSHESCFVPVVCAAAAWTGASTPIIDVNNFEPGAGLAMQGAELDGRAGDSVSSAGDFNGDGFDDLIVGIRGGDPGCREYAGRACVVFGGPGFGEGITTTSLEFIDGTNGFFINGASAGDLLGRSVAGGGDLNHDGIDDLAIIGSGSGELAVVFGRRDPGPFPDVEVSALDGTGGFRVPGLGISTLDVTFAGDVNADGMDDLLIGSDYGAYVLYGDPALGDTGSFFLSEIAPNRGFAIENAPRDHVGRFVSPAGDLNNDGIDDMLIGGAARDPDVLVWPAQSYLVFGTATPRPSGVIRSDEIVDEGAGVLLTGLDGSVFRALDGAGVGDLNADGIDDLALGNREATRNGVQNSGEVLVRFGPIASPDDPPRGTMIATNGYIDWVGDAVAAAGDLNGDGTDDLAISAPLAGSGTVFVVFGGDHLIDQEPVDLTALDATEGYAIMGLRPGALTGQSLAVAGDINVDGITDLLIGAPRSSLGYSIPYCNDPEIRVFTGYQQIGVVHTIAGFRTPCAAADLTAPFGTLDLTDVGAFIDAFLAGAPAADLDGSGVADLADITIFVESFVAGCP